MDCLKVQFLLVNAGYLEEFAHTNSLIWNMDSQGGLSEISSILHLNQKHLLGNGIAHSHVNTIDFLLKRQRGAVWVSKQVQFQLKFCCVPA